MTCSCPDGAWLCKHLAAVLYGVGARFDRQPELIFVLRGVDQTELIARAGDGGLATGKKAKHQLNDESLSAIFGIELDEQPAKVARKRGAKRG